MTTGNKLTELCIAVATMLRANMEVPFGLLAASVGMTEQEFVAAWQSSPQYDALYAGATHEVIGEYVAARAAIYAKVERLTQRVRAAAVADLGKLETDTKSRLLAACDGDEVAADRAWVSRGKHVSSVDQVKVDTLQGDTLVTPKGKRTRGQGRGRGNNNYVIGTTYSARGQFAGWHAYVANDSVSVWKDGYSDKDQVFPDLRVHDVQFSHDDNVRSAMVKAYAYAIATERFDGWTRKFRALSSADRKKLENANDSDRIALVRSLGSLEGVAVPREWQASDLVVAATD